MAIKIKPSHKGALHRAMGIAQGKKIPVARLKAAKMSRDKAERKEATFALNARKWKR